MKKNVKLTAYRPSERTVWPIGRGNFWAGWWSYPKDGFVEKFTCPLPGGSGDDDEITKAGVLARKREYSMAVLGGYKGTYDEWKKDFRTQGPDIWKIKVEQDKDMSWNKAIPVGDKDPDCYPYRWKVVESYKNPKDYKCGPMGVQKVTPITKVIQTKSKPIKFKI